MTNVAVVLGSTRPGRVGEGVAQWVVSEANKVEGVNASVVDLADFELPFFAEPMPPSCVSRRSSARPTPLSS